jgi:hypothetical protein
LTSVSCHRALVLLSLLTALACTSDSGSVMERATSALGNENSDTTPWRKVVADSAECQQCTITLGDPVVLGSTTSPDESLNWPVAIARLANGHYLASYSTERGVLVRHDSSGAWLTTIGRLGDGPGEYRYPQLLKVTAGDTVHVFDAFARRRTVLTPEGEYVRHSALPASPMSAAILPGDKVVMGSATISGVGAGLPLHSIAPAGTVAMSFGADTARAHPDSAHLLGRTIAIDADGALWSSMKLHYRIDRLDADGQRTGTIIRDAPWFTGTSASPTVSAEHAPTPQVRDIRVDRVGRLEVLITVAGERWQEGVGSISGEGNRPVGVVVDPPRYYDSVIEVLDWRAGVVVARMRTDDALMQFVGADHVLSLSELPSGERVARIWRVERSYDRP